MWYWEKTDPSRSVSSGDLSKRFKNEHVKQPGVFSTGAPSADATVLAREVIQNSWDAAIELRQDSDDAYPFEIRFGSARAERKRHLIARLGLDELAERLDGSDGEQRGLHSPNCLEQLSEDGVLPYLLIEAPSDPPAHPDAAGGSAPARISGHLPLRHRSAAAFVPSQTRQVDR